MASAAFYVRWWPMHESVFLVKMCCYAGVFDRSITFVWCMSTLVSHPADIFLLKDYC